LGKLVIGYGFGNDLYYDKVISKVSHDGMSVEDFGEYDNIMLVHGLDFYEKDFIDALHKIWKLDGN
jgi:hypothetical protein